MYMDFSFFTTDNKSGHKTREEWLEKNHPELYHKIIEYASKLRLEMNFKEKIWFFYNQLTHRPVCKTCSREIKFRNRFDKPYGEFCSLECINTNKTEMLKRQQKTFKEKYNVDFYPKHKDFTKKSKKTKKEKYGDENYNNSYKSKKTKKEKYGDENYNNLDKYQLTCINRYGVKNYASSNNYQTKIIDKFKGIYPDVLFTNIDKQHVTIFCGECHTETQLTKQLLYERYKRNHILCTKCNPIGNTNKSQYEIEMSEFLTSIQIPHEKSRKILTNNKELDIVIPTKNLAIEINGVYWHNELFVESTYHLEKTIECNKIGVKLLHIFEDEWVYKKEIIKSIIKNRLNKIDNVIYARNTKIKKVNNNEAKKFLEENHIQGNVNSKVNVGLYHNETLVSLMCFSKGRIVVGGKKDEWELTRFCNLININVIGGASKLFKYFLENYKPKKIISYSDIRLFDGELYRKLKFEKKSQSKPNYWYVVNGIRKHRFNFRKGVLIKEGFDKSKTEKEIMFDRKYYRIYDCGNLRWEFSL